MKIDPNTKAIVYTPQEISDQTVKEINYRRETKDVGIKFGIPEIDNMMLPFRPGELVSVIGNTSNYKSGLMMFLARRALEQLKDNEIVVYVTWEQAVEEHALMELANVTDLDASGIARGTITDEDYKRLEQAAVKRAHTPLWLIGHSIQNRKKRPHLTLDDVAKAMTLIEDEWGYKPAMICLDYLQLMESDSKKYRDRRLEQADAVSRCKDMTYAMGCTVIVGSQAKQEVTHRAWKLPGIYDSMETSALAHASDKGFGVWIPATTERLGERIGVPEIEVTQNLLIINLAKQKFGPAPKYFYSYFEPEKNIIKPMHVPRY